MLDLDAGNTPSAEVSAIPPPRGLKGETSIDPLPETDDLLTIERQLAATTQPPIQDLPPSGETEKVAYYIQVIERDQAAVLRTNLPRTDTVKPTEQGVAWLLGRSRNCTIVFPDPAISRCHAVLSYHPSKGFQLMDAGSSNGTFLNGQRLIAMATHRLQDGDVLTISHIGVKLFILQSAN
ncbi:FHA domain-containing protein [filamentous cyanobacterium LEGE 11480]|uniref:FHA domain-containing protein n=1 Tax=Romeriopsis navalis LEGE 11480 TaxID=2777977 RepID=A0A928VLX8_9CYAN|nr:FHA domain-containing protein [Romeriopsis navalis]MBE9028269.1 FHA domain-containing protein [Romeriopsis navalis LEGE 11480]